MLHNCTHQAKICGELIIILRFLSTVTEMGSGVMIPVKKINYLGRQFVFTKLNTTFLKYWVRQSRISSCQRSRYFLFFFCSLAIKGIHSFAIDRSISVPDRWVVGFVPSRQIKPNTSTHHPPGNSQFTHSFALLGCSSHTLTHTRLRLRKSAIPFVLIHTLRRTGAESKRIEQNKQIRNM